MGILTGGAAHADPRGPSPFPVHNEMPLDSQIQVPAGDKIEASADMQSLPAAERTWASFDSRTEAEGKVLIPGESKAKVAKNVAEVVARLDALAADPQLAAKVLGAQWKIVKGAVFTGTDVFLDSVEQNYPLAQNDAVLRVRQVRENGKPSPTRQELNYKPPGMVRIGPNGIIMLRVEKGLHMGMNPDLKAMPTVESHYNPIYGMPQDVTTPVGKGVSDRNRYMMMRLKQGGNSANNADWEPLIDISADDTTSRAITIVNGQMVLGDKTVHYGQLEAELLHRGTVGNGTATVAAAEGWQHPHQPSDLERLVNDQNVKDLISVLPTLVKHVGLDLVRAPTKYGAAATQLGLIKARTVTPIRDAKSAQSGRPAKPARQVKVRSVK